MLEEIVQKAPLFLIICARCFAMVMTLPLFSIRSVSRIAKLALTGFMAYILLPHFNFNAYMPFLFNDGAFSLEFILIVAGEVLIGIIAGFFVNIIFLTFSTV